MQASRPLVAAPVAPGARSPAAERSVRTDRSERSRGWVRAANAAWWDADLDVDRDALHVHRLGHVQPHLRLTLDRIRSIQEVGSFGRSFRQVDLTTTTGAVINLRWSPHFGERVVRALRASLDRPPAPLPVPGDLALSPGPFPGVPKVGAPDLAEASRAALRSVVRGAGRVQLTRGDGVTGNGVARLDRRSQGRRRLRGG